MRPYLIFLFLSISAAGCGQEAEWRYIPLVDTVFIPLGDTIVPIRTYRYSPHISAPFFIHLHHNELAADSALHSYLAFNGGSAVGIHNNRQRFISFKQGQKRYLFDPNRMFTPGGTRQSLQLLSSYHPQAAQTISQLAASLLQLLPANEPVIAMHNNTDGAYSILSYAAGGTYEAETKALFYNPKMDKDDFVLTTDPRLFAYLKGAAVNAVLQDSDRAFDDGSLGYFLGRQARPYVNIEAEHGHYQEQVQLIAAVIQGLKSTTAVVPQMSYQAN